MCIRTPEAHWYPVFPHCTPQLTSILVFHLCITVYLHFLHLLPRFVATKPPNSVYIHRPRDKMKITIPSKCHTSTVSNDMTKIAYWPYVFVYLKPIVALRFSLHLRVPL